METYCRTEEIIFYFSNSEVFSQYAMVLAELNVCNRAKKHWNINLKAQKYLLSMHIALKLPICSILSVNCCPFSNRYVLGSSRLFLATNQVFPVMFCLLKFLKRKTEPRRYCTTVKFLWFWKNLQLAHWHCNANWSKHNSDGTIIYFQSTLVKKAVHKLTLTRNDWFPI